ncbi:hypothetical protein MUK42_00356 [Musa troglodytarum]|uniref:Uncharacterized protein n=1 Tax=Musa troglodytarum TaxID=320322 RepID=A0A9E7FC16_9LILI|nr:hypothetical protein MUK42_00356 [Musa troglodytarum]
MPYDVRQVPLARSFGSIDRERDGEGRVQLKRIENKINRQVTFSKRRSGLLKKAHEISVLCDAEIALIIFSAEGKLYEFASNSCMEKILERYERYCYAEKAIACSDPGPQDNWYREYAKLKAKVEVLHRSQRHLMGEQLDSLTVKELQQLEHQLETSMKQIRSRKTQIMLDSVAELQRKENSLREQNKILEELMEKQKLMAPSHQAQRQQQNQLPSSSSSPPSFPISGLMAESNPLPSIGTFRGRGSVDGDAAAQTQVRNTSNLLPPMDAWPSEWLTSIYDLKL